MAELPDRLPERLVREIRETVREAEELGTEVYRTICQDEETGELFLGPPSPIAVEASIPVGPGVRRVKGVVPHSYCPPMSKTIGHIHVHPKGELNWSSDDLFFAAETQMALGMKLHCLAAQDTPYVVCSTLARSPDPSTYRALVMAYSLGVFSPLDLGPIYRLGLFEDKIYSLEDGHALEPGSDEFEEAMREIGRKALEYTWDELIDVKKEDLNTMGRLDPLRWVLGRYGGLPVDESTLLAVEKLMTGLDFLANLSSAATVCENLQHMFDDDAREKCLAGVMEAARSELRQYLDRYIEEVRDDLVEVCRDAWELYEKLEEIERRREQGRGGRD